MDKVCSKCFKPKPATTEYFHKKLGSLCAKCKDCISSEKKLYQLDKGSEISNRRKLKRKNSPVECRKKDKERYLRNKTAILGRSTKRCIERYNEDPVYRFRKLTCKQLRMVITGYRVFTDKSKMFEIVGLTGIQLLDYLWAGFESKYSVSRDRASLSNVQIDHIIPLSTAKTIEDIKKLNHYTNLQLLSKEDNVKKGSKLPDELVKEIENEKRTA